MIPAGILASARRASAAPIDLLTGVRLRLEATDLGAAGSSAKSWINKANGQTGKIHSNTVYPEPVVAAATTPNGNKCVTWGSTSYAGSGLDFGPVMHNDNDVAWIYASTNYNDATYPVAYLLDGSNATTHLANSQTTNYDVKLKSAKVVTGYTINATGGRAPKSWTFLGSNDGTNWTLLDTRTPEAFTGVDRSFSFTNATAYLYYRLAVTATNNAEAFVTMSKLRFTGANLDCSTVPTSACLYAVVKAPAAGSTTFAQFNSAVNWYLNRGTGSIYDGWGSTTLAISAQLPVVDATQWRVVQIVNNAGAWSMKLDSSLQASVSGKTLGFIPMSLIGSTFIGYSAAFSGQIAAVLALDHAPTTQEDSDIRAHYLSTYGV